MENKRDTKGVLLIVFVVISLLLGGFVVYDKLLKKEEGVNCPKTDCQCEKCTKNDDSNSNTKLILSSRYTNADEKKVILLLTQ